MPSIIGKCKLFRIKHIALLEGETFLRNKHEIAFFEIKCTFFGRKENTIKETKSLKYFSLNFNAYWVTTLTFNKIDGLQERMNQSNNKKKRKNW